MIEEELYDDVLLDVDKERNEEEEKKFQERIVKSIGWVDVLLEGKTFVEQDENGVFKVNGSSITNIEARYDVYLGGGRSFTCDKQSDAEVLSKLVQNNIRLKRIEDNIIRLMKNGSE